MSLLSNKLVFKPATDSVIYRSRNPILPLIPQSVLQANLPPLCYYLPLLHDEAGQKPDTMRFKAMLVNILLRGWRAGVQMLLHGIAPR